MSAARHRSAQWGTWLLLLIGLGLVVLVRVAVPYGDVFRNGDVVLVANDPYAFLYMVEQLLASDVSPIRPMSLAEVPESIRTHDVLFVVAVWGLTVVLGRDPATAATILAWYPVVAAVVVASLLYLLVRLVTDDRRIALLAVVLLALTPANAYRTMLGFGDHDAFGYVLVAVTATALVRLATVDPDGRSWMGTERRVLGNWVAALAFGVGVAGACFAWRGGPILLIPVGVFALASVVSCVRHDRSPLPENVGLLLGLCVASTLSLGVHLVLNWADPYRGFAPLLLLALVIGVVTVGELSNQMRLPWAAALVVVPGVGGAWLVGLWTGTPIFASPLHRFVEFFGQFPREPDYQIGETVSLVATPELPLLLFGLLLVVAVPAMGWVLVECWSTHRPGWLVLSAYAWTLLTLSIVQLRFAGLLAVFVAVFGAIGVLYLAARMGVVRPLSVFEAQRDGSLLDGSPVELAALGRSVGLVLLVVVLVTGLGVAQIPGTMAGITHDETTYETATWMAEYSVEQEWTYPENYVFSAWGSNRYYNHAVSGQSRSYGYASQQYREFVSSSDAVGWYDELAGRTGFIVVEQTRFAYPADSLQVRLYNRLGSAGDGVDGLSHYRLVYVSDDRTTTVFTLVPGATIVGNASATESVQLETVVTIDDASFTYQRTVPVSPDGQYEVTVPYPGAYTVGSDVVTVDEADVTDGNTVTAD